MFDFPPFGILKLRISSILYLDLVGTQKRDCAVASGQDLLLSDDLTFEIACVARAPITRLELDRAEQRGLGNRQFSNRFFDRCSWPDVGMRRAGSGAQHYSERCSERLIVFGCFAAKATNLMRRTGGTPRALLISPHFFTLK
jgi:hypothetical protein